MCHSPQNVLWAVAHLNVGIQMHYLCMTCATAKSLASRPYVFSLIKDERKVGFKVELMFCYCYVKSRKTSRSRSMVSSRTQKLRFWSRLGLHSCRPVAGSCIYRVHLVLTLIIASRNGVHFSPISPGCISCCLWRLPSSPESTAHKLTKTTPLPRRGYLLKYGYLPMSICVLNFKR